MSAAVTCINSNGARIANEAIIERIVDSAKKYLIELKKFEESQEKIPEKCLRSSLRDRYLLSVFTKEQIIEELLDAQVSPACWRVFLQRFDQWDKETKPDILPVLKEEFINFARQYLIRLNTLNNAELVEFSCDSLKEQYLYCAITKQQLMASIDPPVSQNCWRVFLQRFDQWDKQIQKGILKKDPNDSFHKDYIVKAARQYLLVLNTFMNSPTFLSFMEIHNEFEEEFKNDVIALLNSGYSSKEIKEKLQEGGVTNPYVLERLS